jgi:hypothetical protein
VTGGGLPAIGQQVGEVARPAAEVHDSARVLRGDPLDQLDEGAAAFVGVGQVAIGVPGVVHKSSTYLDVKTSPVCRRRSLDVKILDGSG